MQPRLETAVAFGDRTTPLARVTSFGQRRLWLADQMSDHGLEYIYPYAMRLRGPLDRDALQAALDAIVARHDTLRTTYELIGDEPYQFVHEDAALEIELRSALDLRIDGSRLPEPVRADLAKPFDLVSGPVMRVTLYRLSEQDHLLVVVVHHIATDGWSMDIFFRELAGFYNARCSGRPAERAPLQMQYADFAEWQRGSAEEPGALEPQLAYWRRRLADAPLTLELPGDRRRPESQTFRGGVVTFEVPAEAASAMDAVVRETGASRFMALLATVHLTLARWSGATDMIIGTPLAHRPIRETEDLIGFFVNLLPFRLQADERLTFAEALARTRDVALEAYDNSAVTFERIVEEVAPVRSLAHNPVVQVAITDETSAAPTFDGLELQTLAAHLDLTRYDLAFDYVSRPDGGLTVDLFYAADLFDRSTVERLADTFVRDFGVLAGSPDRPMHSLPRVAEPPVRREAATQARSIQGGLATVARTDPGRLAIVAGERELTFGELDAEVEQLAGRLRAAGVAPGDVVAICLPRDVTLLVALAATWRAGAVQLPLDPAYPAGRLEYMLVDSGARTVLSWPSSPMAWPQEATVIDVGHRSPADAMPERSAEEWPERTAPDLAYIIYTSGSTGRPKGVAVTHGAVAALVRGLEQTACFGAEPAVVGWNASVSFDASVHQWVRIYRGDSVVLLTEDERRDPDGMAAVIVRREITDLDFTPSHLAALTSLVPDVSARLGRRLQLLIGGEAIPAPLWSTLQEWHASGVATSVNLYGPTENTVDSILAWVHEHETPHIGHPLPGVAAYVLDPWWRPVPEGTTGELYLAGDQLAEGYWRRPDETALRFVPDTVANDGGVMYRTGDLVRSVGGALQFHGRADDQIKVRGYRIELGEIEEVLGSAPGVTSAAAALTADGQAIGAAYTAGPDVSPEAVRQHAATQLPAFMMPSLLLRVAAIPRTGSGKVDRRELAEQFRAAADVPPEVALDGPIEELIAGVWSEVLRAATIGPHDNFFDLGGHSLLAIRLVARVKQRLSLKLPLSAVFEHATLRELAAHIAGLMRAELARRPAG